jgi:phosphate transport system substrate-binding protein
MKARSAVTFASSALLLSALTGFASAADLRISGAATVANAIIKPNLAAIQQDTGLTLVMTVNGDGNGLNDLYAGRSDVAMIAAPMKATEDTMNRTSPGSLSIAGFEYAAVGSASIHFIVNPENPVHALTAAQLRDIFTGKVTSWKDVGGKDAPILIVAESAGLGTRANVVMNFLGGSDIAPGARTMQALVQLVQVTSQSPDAISYGNSASINASVTVIPGTEVKQELGLATKGKPSPDEVKLIAAVVKYGIAAH